MNNKSKFKFGPLQRKWLRALESGKFKKAVGRLKYKEIDGTFVYCCLGVANEVCELGEKSEGSHSLLFTYEKIGLYGSIGQKFSPSKYKYLPALTELNDEHKWSFKKIAAHLRKNAEAYFSHSA